MSEEYVRPRRSIDTVFMVESSRLLLEHGIYKGQVNFLSLNLCQLLPGIQSWPEPMSQGRNVT